MRYSLWSRHRLLGHTDLDIPCVTKHLMQGFIDPTPDGSSYLPEATGVPRASSARLVKNVTEAEQLERETEFRAACSARDALDLELRLEDGTVFLCDFIRVYDLRDNWWTEESLDEDEPLDAEMRAEIAEFEAEVAEWEEERLWGSAWPPAIPEDPRWDTMQYHIQVFLEGAYDTENLLAPDFDDL